MFLNVMKFEITKGKGGVRKPIFVHFVLKSITRLNWNFQRGGEGVSNQRQQHEMNKLLLTVYKATVNFYMYLLSFHQQFFVGFVFAWVCSSVGS